MERYNRVLLMKAVGCMVLSAIMSGCGMEFGPRESGPETLPDSESLDRPAWLTDFEQAQARAKDTGRPILVNFSGSDWCGWCIRLDNEVFKQTEFKDYAEEHLVLFIADFPRRTKLPEATVRQNEALAERFNVRGFPTILLLDADGTVLARTGYREGGAKAYIEHIEELLAEHMDNAAGT